jgi:hypothetical protein
MIKEELTTMSWRDGVPRRNFRLNEEIERFIRQWEGTAKGEDIKNMWENGTSYEHICEAAGIDYDEYEED